jgi:hypothetical protein
MEAKNGSDFLMCQKKSDEGIFYEHHDDTSDSFCFLVKVKVYFSSREILVRACQRKNISEDS